MLVQVWTVLSEGQGSWSIQQVFAATMLVQSDKLPAQRLAPCRFAPITICVPAHAGPNLSCRARTQASSASPAAQIALNTARRELQARCSHSDYKCVCTHLLPV